MACTGSSGIRTTSEYASMTTSARARSHAVLSVATRAAGPECEARLRPDSGAKMPCEIACG